VSAAVDKEGRGEMGRRKVRKNLRLARAKSKQVESKETTFLVEVRR
jgi:hypothetical protein